MRFLLDTHAFIWLGCGNLDALGKEALKAYEDTDNEILLSMASLWEMAIKINIGKLSLSKPLKDLIKSTESSGISILPISADHILKYQTLPLHHSDPFDRLIISSAYTENMTVLTCDDKFALYDQLSILW